MHIYDLKLAKTIDKYGIDRQALLDGFPFGKTESEEVKKQTTRRGYRLPPDLSTEERVKICEMYRKGVKLKAIADCFKMRVQSINRVIDSAEVKRHRMPRTRVDRAAAVQLLMAGVAVSKIAEVLNCHAHTIRMYRKELTEAGRLKEC